MESLFCDSVSCIYLSKTKLKNKIIIIKGKIWRIIKYQMLHIGFFQ